MMLSNASLAMLSLLVLAMVVVYYGIIKGGAEATRSESVRQSIDKAALQIYFNLADVWDLSYEEEAALLGCSSVRKLDWLKDKNKVAVLDKNMVLKISRLMNIYHNLITLLPDVSAANEWPKKPNTASMLNGETALKYMIDGGTEGIISVHNYLDGELL